MPFQNNILLSREDIIKTGCCCSLTSILFDYSNLKTEDYYHLFFSLHFVPFGGTHEDTQLTVQSPDFLLQL